MSGISHGSYTAISSLRRLLLVRFLVTISSILWICSTSTVFAGIVMSNTEFEALQRLREKDAVHFDETNQKIKRERERRNEPFDLSGEEAFKTKSGEFLHEHSEVQRDQAVFEFPQSIQTLIKAIKEHSAESVLNALNDEVRGSVDLSNSVGSTALHIAVEVKAPVEIIKILLSEGADPHHADIDGVTPLWLASGAGSLDTMAELLDAGVHVNSAENEIGLTPLHVATHFGHENAVNLLISAGANIEAVDADEQTPLMTAVENNYPNLVSVLAKTGASVTKPNIEGSHPVHVAADLGYLEVLSVLSTFGADINARDIRNATCLKVAALNGRFHMVEHLVQEYGANIDAQDSMGATPLHVAVAHGHVETIQELLSLGADPNAHDFHGYTPLHVAVMRAQVESVQILLNFKGIDIHRKSTYIDEHNRPVTALDLAKTMELQGIVHIFSKHSEEAVQNEL